MATARSEVRVSVVIPCYNAGAYIAEAIASVAAQAVAGLELIVVDDGSTDDSMALAERHGAALGATVVRQTNAGAAVARNRGLSHASGATAAFLDADDVWPDGSLAARLALLDADRELGVVGGLLEPFVSPDLAPEEASRLGFAAGVTRACVPGTMVVRRAVLERVGAFDASLRMGEAIDWMARAQATGVRIGYADTVVVRRRIHATNSTRTSGRLRGDYLKVLRASIARGRAAVDAP